MRILNLNQMHLLKCLMGFHRYLYRLLNGMRVRAHGTMRLKSMQNKLMQILLFISVIFAIPAIAEVNDKADAYDPSGSMFEKITDLEQKKVLWQLEKENAQMQLDMDRMEAERARIKNEINSINGAETAQTQALELERQRLELEKQKLESQKKNMDQVQTSNK